MRPPGVCVSTRQNTWVRLGIAGGRKNGHRPLVAGPGPGPQREERVVTGAVSHPEQLQPFRSTCVKPHHQPDSATVARSTDVYSRGAPLFPKQTPDALHGQACGNPSQPDRRIIAASPPCTPGCAPDITAILLKSRHAPSGLTAYSCSRDADTAGPRDRPYYGGLGRSRPGIERCCRSGGTGPRRNPVLRDLRSRQAPGRYRMWIRRVRKGRLPRRSTGKGKLAADQVSDQCDSQHLNRLACKGADHETPERNTGRPGQQACQIKERVRYRSQHK